MNPEYIYILQNKSYGKYLVKIGMTAREPDTRAKEIYFGASGVPEKFHMVFACQVNDCSMAEKKIHQLLKSYRHNKNREFFFIKVEVAKKILLHVCKEVNGASSIQDLITIEKPLIDSSEDLSADPFNTVSIPIKSILGSLLPGTSLLSEEQIIRVEVIAETLKEVYPNTCEYWIEGFSCDIDPEREIQIWEHIVKAFLKIEKISLLDDNQRIEALHILIMRSNSSSRTVLSEFKFNKISRKAAKEILREYESSPIPIEASVLEPGSIIFPFPTF
jgi:T5orf172 domain